jgi:hypothetical protein
VEMLAPIAVDRHDCVTETAAPSLASTAWAGRGDASMMSLARINNGVASCCAVPYSVDAHNHGGDVTSFAGGILRLAA